MGDTLAPTISVTALAEQGFLVRGTQDPHEALQAVLALHDCDEVDDLLWRVTRGGDEEREWVMRFGDRLHAMLADAVPGYWCLARVDDLEADWEYRRAEHKLHGTFEGVLIQ